VQSVASETGSHLVHFECHVPAEVAARRMKERAHRGDDVSDAGPEIQAAQKAMYDPATDAVILDTTVRPEDVLGGALNHLRKIPPRRQQADLSSL